VGLEWHVNADLPKQIKIGDIATFDFEYPIVHAQCFKVSDQIKMEKHSEHRILVFTSDLIY
jgi:hypothetical protein